MNAAIIGGDKRQLFAAEALEHAGCRTVLFGFETCELAEGRRQAPTLHEAMAEADFVLLPFPAETAQETLNAPFCRTPVDRRELLKTLPDGVPVLGGKLSLLLKEEAERQGVTLIDYAGREELSIRNAIPSAEGALQIAMEELPVTLHGAECLVAGYGRIGRALASMLRGIGACVTVSARRASDLEWIRFEGYRALETGALRGKLGWLDVVFNTIPALVFPQDVLEELPPRCLVIDLASMPGGVDFEAARRIGRKTIHALSLPGKTAPATAGTAIAETVLQMLQELKKDG